MKIKFLFTSLLLVVIFGSSYGQEKPVFNGGLEAFAKFLQKNMRYPKQDRDKGVEGMVLVKYKIHADNSIDSISIVNSVSRSLDQEALRVFKLSSENWTATTPGYYLFHLRFRLDQEDKLASLKKATALKLKKQDYRSAIDGLNEIRKRNPFDIINLDNLILAYGELGETENALNIQELKKEAKKELDLIKANARSGLAPQEQ